MPPFPAGRNYIAFYTNIQRSQKESNSKRKYTSMEVAPLKKKKSLIKTESHTGNNKELMLT